MDLTKPKIIKELCKVYDIQPSKNLGQNFLVDQSMIDKIVKAGDLKKDDVVLEIGPGFGVLTFEMVDKVKRLVIIEKDKRLVEYLERETSSLFDEEEKTEVQKLREKIEVIGGDALEINLDELDLGDDYKLISNLPYQITSPILWKFLHEEKHKPQQMILMMQKEVGERILAKAPDMNLLAVLCQFYADIEKVCDVNHGNFWPQPKVDSVVLKLKLHTNNDANESELNANNFDEKEFFRMVKFGFSQKRKMLKNNLSNALQIPQEKIIKSLKEIGLSEKVRAQELGVEEWQAMANKIYKL